MSRVDAAPQLSFRIGAARLSLPMRVVREVLTLPAVVPVPGSRAHISGVALHRGLAVPVYDLRRFVPLWSEPPGQEPDAGAGAHLIVCAWGEAVVGMVGVDTNLVDESSLQQGETDSPGPVKREYLTGVLASGEEGLSETIACLDPSRLFPSLGVPLAEAGSAQEVNGEDDPAGR